MEYLHRDRYICLSFQSICLAVQRLLEGRICTNRVQRRKKYLLGPVEPCEYVERKVQEAFFQGSLIH